MGFTTFDQVIDYMENYMKTKDSRPNHGSVRTFRLDRMRAIMAKIGNPQNCYKTIHVAGSKGKGSTCSYIAKGLSAAGFKTGLYMSPHVSDYRERFTLNGEFIDDETLISVGNILQESLKDFSFEDYLGESCPTTFELYTAYAFLLFKEMGCQWAVIETGLGGRLDATNILDSEASVLTPIELEHTDVLGDTIEKIAIEKSKIIKKGKPSFTSIQKPEATRVLKAEAKAQESLISCLEEEALILERTNENGEWITHLVLKDGYDKNLRLSMQGQVQSQNCALAILVLRKLGLYKKDITEKALEGNVLPGRMEMIPWKRNMYLDVAHTTNSMSHLMKTFSELYPGKKGICIFGSIQGKSHEEMARTILDNFDKVVICRPGTYRKSDPKLLYDIFSSLSTEKQNIVLKMEAIDALQYCLDESSPDEPILICGSFYLAGEIKEALEDERWH